MVRLWELTRFQKAVIVILLAMLILFTVLYAVTTSRVGYLYQDEIFVPSEENGSLVYRANLQGKPSSFTVTPENVVTFRYGDKTYGPYTAKEDPTAIPKSHMYEKIMTGVEIWDGNELRFRGGVANIGNDSLRLYLAREDGTTDYQIYIQSASGIWTDAQGNVVDTAKPSLYTILELMHGPELTRKGSWLAWFVGLVISVITVFGIFFEDELFRIRISFRVADPDMAEPSDWELMGRPIGYTVQVIAALVIYCIGLQ